MKSNTLLLLGLAVAAYYLYNNYATPSVNFVTCKYPDGSTIQVPTGNACPYDATHGGQSMPCGSLPAGVVGPVIPC